MKCTESLKKNYQFRTVYGRGRSLANRLLVAYVLANGLPQNRLGLSVSKKVGKSVTRSRVARLIRESYRLQEMDMKIGLDIVIIARAGAADADFYAIGKSLRHLLRKHGVLSVTEDGTDTRGTK